MEFEQLLENYEEAKRICNMFSREISRHKDGYIYVANIRSYGSNSFSTFNNYHTLKELCDEYNGDNGIVDIYSNNPKIPFVNYSGTKHILSDEVMNKINEADGPWAKAAIIRQCFQDIDE